ncbi:DUF1797 family protein [Periweissella cryptocerci]|uniref:DUF1797 family protein n=1 Tax=Periweissella cryptocerci TaxID=2506420 RepID=A0A4P6YV31_9LACO|nr:DUF1797 family protein [Periweissella cryptocerci]QBO36658.1 DUF1797 family protein [Periweissella cryptocerci]
MKQNLQQIIERLKAMRHDRNSDTQIRNFDAFGVAVCTVTFNQLTNLFEVDELFANRHFEFDNLDLAAIEVYDQLHDFQTIF